MPSKPYNGHKSYNAWNVSLWINNDEWLYNLARKAIRITRNRKQAALYFMEHARPATGDGVPYTVTNVMAAMVGM